jgi:hypothetical protein
MKPVQNHETRTKVDDQKPVRVGVFSTVDRAEEAVRTLRERGFTRAEITVICSDAAIERHFREFSHQEPAGANTAAAATTGGVIGATLGGFTALAFATATGGIGLLAAGGLAAWSGGIVGGLVGAMMTRGVEKSAADFYDQAVTAGKILVAVEADSAKGERRLADAAEILAAAGAEPVSLPEG